MAQAPTIQPPVRPGTDGSLPGLRDVRALPLRVGRHLTAWILWHTSRISLLDEAPPPAELDRAARA